MTKAHFLPLIHGTSSIALLDLENSIVTGPTVFHLLAYTRTEFITAIYMVVIGSGGCGLVETLSVRNTETHNSTVEVVDSIKVRLQIILMSKTKKQ